MNRVLKYASCLVVAGLCVYVFVLFAQANIHDLRERYGHRISKNIDVEIGSFYVVNADGRLQGPPVCRNLRSDLKSITKTEVRNIELTNLFGSQLPLISEWTSKLMLPLDSATFLQEAGAEISADGKSGFEYFGHTLVLNEVEIDKITSMNGFNAYHRLLLASEGCEETFNTLYAQNKCVVPVFETLKKDGLLLGVKLYGQFCYIKRAADGEGVPKVLKIPNYSEPLLKRVASMKNGLGLIDSAYTSPSGNVISSLPQVSANN